MGDQNEKNKNIVKLITSVSKEELKTHLSSVGLITTGSKKERLARYCVGVVDDSERDPLFSVPQEDNNLEESISSQLS